MSNDDLIERLRTSKGNSIELSNREIDWIVISLKLTDAYDKILDEALAEKYRKPEPKENNLDLCDECKIESKELENFEEVDGYGISNYRLCPSCLEDYKYKQWERDYVIKD